MDDVLRRLAEALGVEALTPSEQGLLLDCAREVAHGTQRRHAPLSTFLLGMAVGGFPGDRETAMRDAVERVRAVVSAAPGPTETPR